MPVKISRKLALTYDDRRQGRYIEADAMVFGTDVPDKIFGDSLSGKR